MRSPFRVLPLFVSSCDPVRDPLGRGVVGTEHVTVVCGCAVGLCARRGRHLCVFLAICPRSVDVVRATALFLLLGSEERA